MLFFFAYDFSPSPRLPSLHQSLKDWNSLLLDFDLFFATTGHGIFNVSHTSLNFFRSLSHLVVEHFK